MCYQENLTQNLEIAQRKWAHKIGKLLEPRTRNIPCLNI